MHFVVVEDDGHCDAREALDLGNEIADDNMAIFRKFGIWDREEELSHPCSPTERKRLEQIISFVTFDERTKTFALIGKILELNTKGSSCTFYLQFWSRNYNYSSVQFGKYNLQALKSSFILFSFDFSFFVALSCCCGVGQT